MKQEKSIKDSRMDEFDNEICSALFCLVSILQSIGYSSRCSTIWSDQCAPLSRGTLLRAAVECQWSI